MFLRSVRSFVGWVARLNPGIYAKARAIRAYWPDVLRYAAHSGLSRTPCYESKVAELTMAYHQIEKGLTMPDRRLNFGHNAILKLMKLSRDFESAYGRNDVILRHAIGCVRAYLELHRAAAYDFSSENVYWNTVKSFDSDYADIPIARQYRMLADDFYKNVSAPFPLFAASRHTLRHYEGTVSVDRITEAVRLAMTAPSACNRQHVRVHCLTQRNVIDDILGWQGASRGFGHKADKLLIVTSDVHDLLWEAERNDGYINAGIFIMNLCYALHYHRIAHCLLNWSVNRQVDVNAHELVGIEDNEEIAIVIACGNAPSEVDFAASPRRPLENILTIH